MMLQIFQGGYHEMSIDTVEECMQLIQTRDLAAFVEHDCQWS